MAISAKDVNKLRQMTGAGMMDCKKALEEANGDFDEAVTILRKKGQKISSKRADVEANEGAVFVKTSDDQKTGMVVSLRCETDFVAKNEGFVELGQKLIELALDKKPTNLEEFAAMDMDGLSVNDQITEYMGKIGEKIQLSSLESVDAEKVVSYIHSNNKIAVLLGMNGVGSSDVSEVGRDIAMQVAAMRPVALDKDGVDPAIIEKEIEIGKEQARQEGKPENILEKIAMGKLNKFYKENTLLNQQFVKDSSKTITQLLKDVSGDLSINEFKRVEIA